MARSFVFWFGIDSEGVAKTSVQETHMNDKSTIAITRSTPRALGNEYTLTTLDQWQGKYYSLSSILRIVDIIYSIDSK